MRKTLLGVAGAAALLLAVPSPGFSGSVNCGIIMKDLEAGRDPKDIAELKAISIDEVKKCQAEAGGAKAGGAADATGKPGAAAENPKTEKEAPVGSGGH